MVNGGKGFNTFVDNYRLPYSWGDIKNGRLGIDVDGIVHDDKNNIYSPADRDKLIRDYDDNRMQIALPYRLPEFA